MLSYIAIYASLVTGAALFFYRGMVLAKERHRHAQSTIRVLSEHLKNAETFSNLDHDKRSSLLDAITVGVQADDTDIIEPTGTATVGDGADDAGD